MVIQNQIVYEVFDEINQLGSISARAQTNDEWIQRNELSIAATCYALSPENGTGYPPREWPWQASAWNPSTRYRNLIKAIALLMIEIQNTKQE
ncbi:hypothetical protein [Bartonella choladocola]|uniref:Uncharacterized protein n=1 Tax=Bartonella choladocola TaxID=2750995 RepID=A0A1U9MJ89_9HYPH|nr:hypothetical protein [Bartonella choladocola]AQT47985.1 hypothetical protein BBC0122_018900 [Bartonella choladocola]